MEMDRINGAAKAIEAACGPADIGMILGSGLGDSITSLQNARTIAYKDIPGFPTPTVPGHSGEWATGDMHGKRVAIMRGRFHFYEGYPIHDVVLPVRVMRQLGVKTLLVTNAAGGVNTDFTPGDLMLIVDMINYSGVNPLIGPNLDAFGPRFPDMSQAFDRGLCDQARTCAAKQGVTLREGVYMWFSGPSFETPAEIRMSRILGADAIGMSTVPEVLVARHNGMRVLGISCITNMAAGILDQPLNHEEVLETGNRVREDFAALIDSIVAHMDI
ncbi:purine-nucleoside phosphorylase [Eubacteriales bacterium OttesenSCG-928-A19]|nr:purine-nucleoside phosphorylase [Eubacteriales bacterium OttesenSCG-928-A19]